MKASLGWSSVTAIGAAFLFASSVFGADGNAHALAPSGKLRAALYAGTPTSVLDPNESNPRGVGFELGRDLARRLGVPYEPIVARP